ncbi:hypothetical protein CEXT_36691, partial [Caerostris extrusa]
VRNKYWLAKKNLCYERFVCTLRDYVLWSQAVNGFHLVVECNARRLVAFTFTLVEYLKAKSTCAKPKIRDSLHDSFAYSRLA